MPMMVLPLPEKLFCTWHAWWITVLLHPSGEGFYSGFPVDLQGV